MVICPARTVLLAAFVSHAAAIVPAFDEVFDGFGDLEDLQHGPARVDDAHVLVAASNVEETSQRGGVKERDPAEIDFEGLGVEFAEPRLDVGCRRNIAFAGDGRPASVDRHLDKSLLLLLVNRHTSDRTDRGFLLPVRSLMYQGESTAVDRPSRCCVDESDDRGRAVRFVWCHCCRPAASAICRHRSSSALAVSGLSGICGASIAIDLRCWSSSTRNESRVGSAMQRCY